MSVQGNGRETGIVKKFDKTKGYGFIGRRQGGPDVFVHHSEIQGPRYGRKALHEGQKVQFEVVRGPKGLKAVKVTALMGAAF